MNNNIMEIATSSTQSVDHVPFIGKIFDTEEEAYDFYNTYAGTIGFGIRRYYYSKSKKDGKLIGRKFVCSKEGVRGKDKRHENIKNPRAETRTNCEAFMLISYDRDINKFIVAKWKSEHNHSLHVKECRHMIRSQRKITANQGINVEMAIDCGISLKSTYELMSTQAGGREFLGFTRKDQENYLRTRRERDLIYGDAGSLLRYFQNETAKNPLFYHGVQLDCDEQVTNIFWADLKMIIDYGFFGDVVSFDTTFKTNKEYRPLGCFVGFNHFRQLVVFGAALLYDETASSFEWLFNTFLHAMSGKKPKTIFTDEDQAMAKAISKVMPDTFHGLCTWHLMQNGLKHLGYLFKENSDFGHELSACVYKYKTEQELILEWENLLNKYGLHDNVWMKAKWQVRNKWALAYMLHTFTAGMRSTQLSESLNSDLRDYLKPDHDIVQFFTHFNRVVKDKRYKEFEAEYGARQKLPRLIPKLPMLEQAASIFTPYIFEKFQKQHTHFLSLVNKGSYELEGETHYLVGFQENEDNYVVRYDHEKNLVSCACKKFERIGILCSHGIKVLDVMNIKMLPNPYILKRWRLDARTGFLQNDEADFQITCKATTDVHNGDDLVSLVSSRYRDLCPKMIYIAQRGSENDGAYQLVSHAIKDLTIQLDQLEISRHDNEKSNVVETEIEIERPTNDIIELQRAKGLKKKDGYKAWGRGRLKPWHESRKTSQNSTRAKNQLTRKSKKEKDKLGQNDEPRSSIPLFEGVSELPNSAICFESPIHPSGPIILQQTTKDIGLTPAANIGANDLYNTEGFFDFLGGRQ